MMSPAAPEGRPRSGSVTKKNFKNLPAPPCLGEALRRVSLQNILYEVRENQLKFLEHFFILITTAVTGTLLCE